MNFQEIIASLILAYDEAPCDITEECLKYREYIQELKDLGYSYNLSKSGIILTKEKLK